MSRCFFGCTALSDSHPSEVASRSVRFAFCIPSLRSAIRGMAGEQAIFKSSVHLVLLLSSVGSVRHMFWSSDVAQLLRLDPIASLY